MLFVLARLSIVDINEFQVNFEYFDDRNNRRNSGGIPSHKVVAGRTAADIIGDIAPAVVSWVNADNVGGGTCRANDIFWTA